jgi:hypothetical protein
MILAANRTTSRNLPKPKTAVARSGLSFEKNLFESISKSAPAKVSVERNPWFVYRDSRSSDALQCQLDILIHDHEFEFYVVVEVKRTWTPLAMQKLKTVYCPVVARALGEPAKPLVICQNLTPSSPMPKSTVPFALLSDEPLMQWLGRGSIRWE